MVPTPRGGRAWTWARTIRSASWRSSPSVQTGEHVLGECRQRVVACAHHDHAVAGARELYDAPAAVIAGRDVFGTAAGVFDQSDDPFAAFGAVDGAAEVDRVAQDREVVRVELVREG